VLLVMSLRRFPFIGLLDPLAQLLERIFPVRRPTTNSSTPCYPDESALETPSLALVDASRETLRMGDTVEQCCDGLWSPS